MRKCPVVQLKLQGKELFPFFFRIGVADGYAYYEVEKVFKTRVRLKWRKDLCLDGYSDHHFCGGGSFSRADVERYISYEEGMAKIFSKK